MLDKERATTIDCLLTLVPGCGRGRAVVVTEAAIVVLYSPDIKPHNQSRIADLD